MPRPSGRTNDQMREVTIETGVSRYAEGSCLIKCGHTHVLCTASVAENVPVWMRGKGKGWVTAEYGMLPRSTHDRMDRESARGRQTGRTQEIQRLIGRALRAVVDTSLMGERQVRIDCDVLQADGGTRTASITGAYIALMEAFKHLKSIGLISEIPMKDSVSAISCGVYKNECVLDLDYAEDSDAETDANFVITGRGGIVEIQGTAEQEPFTDEQLIELLRLAKQGCGALRDIQDAALNKERAAA